MFDAVPFPKRLYKMIRQEALANPTKVSAVSWSVDGRAFFVDNEDLFISEILPKYGFKASKMQVPPMC
jgi:hypothetical protein